jgi:hypothetical protein
MRVQDKVRVRKGPYEGQRAVVEQIGDFEHVLLRLSTGALVEALCEHITNFSAAARLAWKKTPSRKVGRPRGQSKGRISVTLRIHESLWDRFKELEKSGAIADRSIAIEDLLSKKLDELEKQHP